jgi:hypothetical protein
VGRAPWPAADPLVGLLRRVHSTPWLGLCGLFVQVGRFRLPGPFAPFQGAGFPIS